MSNRIGLREAGAVLRTLTGDASTFPGGDNSVWMHGFETAVRTALIDLGAEGVKHGADLRVAKDITDPNYISGRKLGAFIGQALALGHGLGVEHE